MNADAKNAEPNQQKISPQDSNSNNDDLIIPGLDVINSKELSKPSPPEADRQVPSTMPELDRKKFELPGQFGSEIDFQALARELESAAPIKPQEDASRANDDDSQIDLTPEIVTDTLALIYEQQGQIKAAIEAYNILIKKKPDRADFYTQKINELAQKTSTQDGTV